MQGQSARKSHRTVDMHLANGPSASAEYGSRLHRPVTAQREVALVGVGIAAASPFAGVARVTARRQTESPDEKAHAVLSPFLARALEQSPVGARRRPVDHLVLPSGHDFRGTAIASVWAAVEHWAPVDRDLPHRAAGHGGTAAAAAVT